MSTRKTTVFQFVTLFLAVLVQMVVSTPIYTRLQNLQAHRSHHTTPPATGPNDFPESIKRQVRDSWILDDAIEWSTTSPQAAEPVSECIKDNMECPYISGINHKNQPHPTTNKLSTSPWKFVQNVDVNRYPRRINEACCVCLNCVNYDMGFPQSSGEKYHSVPIMAHIVVALRNGTDFILERQSITRGCTCAQTLMDVYGGQTV